MPIISAKNNENSRWIGEVQIKKKRQWQKRRKGTQAILKWWELNDFVVRLS